MVEADGPSTDDDCEKEKRQGINTGVTPRKRNIRQTLSLPRPSDCANDGSKPPLVPSSSDSSNVDSGRRSDGRTDFDFRTTLRTCNTAANSAAAAPGDGTSRRKAHGGGHFSSVAMPPKFDTAATCTGSKAGASTGGKRRERSRKPILSSIKLRSNNEKDGTSSSSSLRVAAAATTKVPIDSRSVEERRLNRIVTETGEDAWGVDAVEVWLLENDNSGRLIRQNGGYWRNPDMVTDEFLSRLEDESNPMFVAAEPLLVGVDLPGHLWAEIEGPGGGSGAGGAFDLSGRGGTIFGGASKRGGTIFRPPTPSGSGRGGSLFGSVRGGNRFSFAKVGGSKEENSPQGSGRGGRVFTGGSLKGGDVFAALSQAMGKPSSSRPPTDTSAGIGDDQGSDKNSQGSESDSKAPDSDGKTKKPKHRRLSTWSSSASADPRSKLRRLPRFGAQQQTDEAHGSQGAYIARTILNWRDIHSLIEDPDTPNTPRLTLWHNAGFNYATGVKFGAGYHLQGLVIFYSQLQENAEQLLDFHNQVCMIRATEAIGSVVAANEARKAAMAARPSAAISETDPSTDQGKEEFATDDPLESTCVTIRRRTATWSRKCLGGSLQIPPAMTLRQSLWTLFGCFGGLLLLSGLSDVIHTQAEGELFFFMGPIGALMALQYGLTAAPASQPRNVLLGQAVAGAISLSFTYVPDNIISRWMRQAIAPSLAITAMGKLGVMHPPAGAASIILASGQHGWKHYGLLLLASLISLLPAVFINNASMKRQYPTHSWKATLFKQ